jgi:hypothetical protein
MSDTYTGGCTCGAIHYEISGEPMVTNDCQFRDWGLGDSLHFNKK